MCAVYSLSSLPPVIHRGCEKVFSCEKVVHTRCVK